MSFPLCVLPAGQGFHEFSLLGPALNLDPLLKCLPPPAGLEDPFCTLARLLLLHGNLLNSPVRHGFHNRCPVPPPVKVSVRGIPQWFRLPRSRGPPPPSLVLPPMFGPPAGVCGLHLVSVPEKFVRMPSLSHFFFRGDPFLPFLAYPMGNYIYLFLHYSGLRLALPLFYQVSLDTGEPLPVGSRPGKLFMLFSPFRNLFGFIEDLLSPPRPFRPLFVSSWFFFFFQPPQIGPLLNTLEHPGPHHRVRFFLSFPVPLPPFFKIFFVSLVHFSFFICFRP